MTLFRRLFPDRFDDRLPGHAAALWLLGLYLALKTVMIVNSILNGASVAAGADGIPLERYGAEGAAAVLQLFALNAFGQLLPVLLGAIALLRYRSMVPLVYLLLLLDQAGRRLVVWNLDAARSGSAPGFYINLALVALLFLGLVLSLAGPRQERPPSSPSTGREI